MSRPALEVADIFRDHGAAWRSVNAGHVSLDQMKVISAIEHCRTAALGGHVARCENCAHTLIAYNSCRNRHCPKCQGAAAKEWLAEREAELLPVPYFHLVFTLPAPIADIAYQNKTVIYDLLFKAAAEATLTIAADPKHLGASIGITAVLHTLGSALTHHPHVHMIVPGGWHLARWPALDRLPADLLPPRSRAVSPVPPPLPEDTHEGARGWLSRLLRRPRRTRGHKNIRSLPRAPAQGRVGGLCQGAIRRAAGRPRLSVALHPPRRHSNRRLISADETGVTFKWKDYRIEGPARYKTMTLPTNEFMRRFLMHVLPKGVHRIRHYGLFANGNRAANIARAHELLAMPAPSQLPQTPEAAPVDESRVLSRPCPCCGGRMIIIETFARGCEPKHRPTPAPTAIRIDTS
jgi:Transposase zinc-binding domain/Putative transposase